MPEPLRLVLALHNHQPIGNFDGVFEQAYQDSYRPFLDVLDRFPEFPIALHTSGSLMEWLDAHHPEYLDRLAEMVAAGRLEVIGGAYYEPILTMIPPWDRVGQIRSYTAWLEDRLGGRVRGMWMPERVWEQSLTGDLAEAGIQYTILDDFHFKCAGMTESQLHGYYISEDEGRLISIFPGSERLRYTVPFAQPHETVDYLKWIASEHPGAVVVFGDDGEKFGSWPQTHKHVYQDGWLTRFFEALAAPRLHAGRGHRQRPPQRQGVPARQQLSRNDRMGIAGRATGALRTRSARDGARSPLADVEPVRAGRLLAKL
jgi:alpha-amylase